MKKLLFLLVMLCANTSAFAGYFYDFMTNINEYDPATGLYFAAVQVKEEGGFMKGDNVKTIDVLIYDPATGKETYVFNGKNTDEIVTFLYETGYDEAGAKMLFNAENFENTVKNNHDLKRCVPKNKIIVVTFEGTSKLYTFWITDKSGTAPKVIKKVDEDKDWHIDMLNSKIRFVKQVGQKVQIESTDW